MPLLYPADVEADGEVANTLPAYEVIRRRIKARHSLYIFDSCYSGDIVNLQLNGVRRRQGEPKSESRSIQIITSSANNQTAKDGMDGRSPFAGLFIDGFRQQSNDRISVTSLHSYVARKLTGQESQFESFLPDLNATSGGEFFFIGKRPVDPPTKSIFFQTLGGSHGTLAGSPLSRSWFEETPWLTPAARMILDGDYVGDPRLLPSDSVAAANGSDDRSLSEVVVRAQSWLQRELSTGDEVREIFSILQRLNHESDKVAVIQTALSALNTRTADVSATDLHTMALLECARVRYLEQPPAEDTHQKIEELFNQAAVSYENDDRVGLQARCLADQAHWLLENKKYEDAVGVYSKALARIDGGADVEHLRVELSAGAALACRQTAKRVLTKEAKSTFAARALRDQAQQLWSDSGIHYATLATSIDALQLPADDPTRAYLHERLAWLNMDLWKLAEAENHFASAVSLRELTEMDLVAFLCYANSKQGLAMVDELAGRSGKDKLSETCSLVRERLGVNSKEHNNSSVLYGRLCNTIERLGDCDFLAGRQQLATAIVTYESGLEVCDEWSRVADTAREKESISIQRLRFLSKILIASAVSGRFEIYREWSHEHQAVREIVSVNNGIVLLLCDVAKEFDRYCESRRNADDASASQIAIDSIRTVVHRHSTASLDRESAELLLMLNRIVAHEQQQQDALVLRRLLPQDPSGNPPANMSSRIREQYDRAVMLQGKSYGGGVTSRSEFEKFCDLVRSVQGDKWTSEERRRPFVLFYFPLDGSHGLAILSYGFDDQNIGEVHEIGFGWREVGELDRSLADKVITLVRNSPRAKVGWANDRMLSAVGFGNGQCPFLK
jgi:tetratricopeptide (TPR) repeat protein